MTEKEFKELQEFEEFKEQGLFRTQPFALREILLAAWRAVGLRRVQSSRLAEASFFCAFCASLRLLRISSSSQPAVICHLSFVICHSLRPGCGERGFR